MTKPRLWIIAIIALLGMAGPGLNAGDDCCGHPAIERLLSSLPKSLHCEFLKTLAVSVRAHAANDWQQIYDLLPLHYKNGDTKQEYVERHRDGESDAIVNFQPTKVHSVSLSETSAEGGWFIDGCALVRVAGQKSKAPEGLQAVVEVHRREGKWYFTEIAILYPFHGEEAPPACEFDEQEAIIRTE